MKLDLKPLDEQVVVVFGATSGIGRATAIAAAQRGARVLAAARDQVALDSLATELAATARLEVLAADARDPDEVRAVADRCEAHFGGIDTWAHIAGVAEYGRFEDHTPDELRAVVETDLLGPAYGALAALPALRRRGRGAYVVVSSELAKRSFPLTSAYSAAKHGVNGLVEALRVELQHERVPIAITEIQPAAIDTPFFDHARTRLGVRPAAPPPVYPPEKVAAAVLRAAEHGGRERPVGAAAHVQLMTQRLSPRLMDAFARATAFRLQRSSDPKSASDPDSLERPVVGDDRVHGGASVTR